MAFCGSQSFGCQNANVCEVQEKLISGLKLPI